jgi:hypothetical protein
MFILDIHFLRVGSRDPGFSHDPSNFANKFSLTKLTFNQVSMKVFEAQKKTPALQRICSFSKH